MSYHCLELITVKTVEKNLRRGIAQHSDEEMRLFLFALIPQTFCGRSHIGDDEDHQDVDRIDDAAPGEPLIEPSASIIPDSNSSKVTLNSKTLIRNGAPASFGPLLDQPIGFFGTSTYELFVNGLRRHKGTKREERGSFGVYSGGKYGWITYGEMDRLSRLLGNGLLNLHMHGPVLDEHGASRRMVGIYSEHRLGWTITELGAARQNITLVPIYDSGDASFVWSILSQTNLTTIIASPHNAIKLVDMHIAAGGSTLKNVVVIGELDDKLSILSKYPANGLTVILFPEVLMAGAHGKDALPSRDDISTICFTSGTTGEPKGALISHGNLIAAVGATSQAGFGLNYKDTHFAYLPPAHIFERIIDLSIMYIGGRMGYYSGDLKMLARDVKLVHPTVFVGVPRVYEKTVEKIQFEVSKLPPGLRRKLITSALASAKPSMSRAIVARTMRSRFGGQVRLFLSGGGFLAKPTQVMLERLFQVPVVQGYGMTETTGATLVGNPLSKLYEVVGVPFSCVEVKIVSEDEGDGFDPSTNEGELYVRGPSVFKGYLNNPEATAAILTEDGFVKTGDLVALIRENGENAIRIVGRKKDNFKLASGNYIVPGQYESMYKQCDVISEIMVEPSRDYKRLIALVNIRKDSLHEDDKGLDSAGVKEHVMKCMQLVEDARQIPSADRVGDIFITETDFGAEGPLGSELYTPTMKMKRAVVRRMFEEEFGKM